VKGVTIPFKTRLVANCFLTRCTHQTYIVGVLGGPQLYVEKYGHPRLRARHLPFSIGKSERDQWLMCMDQALDEQIEEPLRQQLKAAFEKVADHMRNN